MVSRRNWSQLPQEFLETIVEKLSTFEDYLSFVGVCRSWRSVLVARRHYAFIGKTLPWLMLPQPFEGEENDEIEEEEDDEEDDDDSEDEDKNHFNIEARKFYSLSKNKVHQFNLPEAVYCHCWGSPYGWLVTLYNEEMNILNPLSNVSVALPPLSSFEYYSSSPSSSVRKVVLANSSSSSTSVVEDQFIALIIFSGEREFLAFARPGDRAWTTFNTPHAYYEDIVQIDNQFYVVDTDGIVRCFDINSPNQVAIDFALPPENISGGEGCRCYLVELLGKLHMVIRFFNFEEMILYNEHYEHVRPYEDHHDAKTYYFKVFELDFCTKEWEEVYTLGNYALFLGYNTSFSLLVSDPLRWKCSSICFTDDYDEESMLYSRKQRPRYSQTSTSCGLDMGIFNLETEEHQPLYTGDDVVSYFCPAFWITPKLS